MAKLTRKNRKNHELLWEKKSMVGLVPEQLIPILKYVESPKVSHVDVWVTRTQSY